MRRLRLYTQRMGDMEQVPSGAGRYFGSVFSRKNAETGGAAPKRRLSARSLVTRDPEWVIWLRRVVLKRRPVLFHFEVPLTDHCSISCRGCTSFSALRPQRLADLGEFESDLRHMAALFSKVRQIHLVGGEPLLHPQVRELCEITRTVFPKSRIYLKTNGTLVMRMSDEFWETLAKNRITLLCDSRPEGVPALEIGLVGKQRRVRVEWASTEREYLKIPIDPRGGYEASVSFKDCQGLNNRPLLRDGHLYPCAYIAYGNTFREHFELPGLQVYPTDWISIREEPDPEQVFAFLRSPVHWCSNCDLENRTWCEWGVSQDHASEWTTAPSPTVQPGGSRSAPAAMTSSFPGWDAQP